MLKSLRISNIKVGNRHRKDMGDLTSLADSIREEGLLQPIGVTEKIGKYGNIWKVPPNIRW